MLAPIGPGALVPFKMAIASADSVGSDVYVAVIVDFGGGSAPSQIVKCVPVPSNDHDADALAAVVGSVNVAYNNSGLLCAIDNYPANGVQDCGESVGSGHYDYWSYWHGTSGSWVYASNGPAEQSVSSSADDVMGMRFQTNEPADSSDPPPAVVPSYAQICNASTEVPPPGSTSGALPTTTTTTTAPTAVAAAPGKPSSGLEQASPSTAMGSGSKPGVTTTTLARGATTTTTTTAGHTVPTGGGDAHGSSAVRRPTVAAAASSHRAGGDSSSDLLPVVLIAAVVAALGGFALFRWRRRPAEE